MNNAFQNFGNYLYYAYANLQMPYCALKDRKPIYDRISHDSSQRIQGKKMAYWLEKFDKYNRL